MEVIKSSLTQLRFDANKRYITDVSPTPLACSAHGIIQVLSVNPSEGESGVPVAVRIRIKPNTLPAVCTRLVFGQRAVATTVQELPIAGPDGWQLVAAAPAFDERTFGQRESISVQLLGMDDTVIDSVTFGDFTYWTSDSRAHSSTPSSESESSIHPITINPSTTLPSSLLPFLRPSRRKATSSLSSVTPDLSHGQQSQIYRRPKLQPSLSDDDLSPILQLLTPLEEICLNWTESEMHQGRRLVKFHKLQQGRSLIVSCEPVPLEDYCEADAVISCIRRAETGEFFVTSVDIIYLLEKLTNDEFPVDEKNRIRRNLEGLHPTTISKHKRGFERFFQRIMKFPHPKPRNIEKDLKVFGWELLSQALFKILSKYAVIAPSTPTSHLEHGPVLVQNPDVDRHPSTTGQRVWRGGTDTPYMFKSEPALPFALSDQSDSDSSLIPPDSPGDWCTQYQSTLLPKEEPFDAFTYIYES